MHSQLTVMVAQEHQYDLQRAAKRSNRAGTPAGQGRRLTIRSPFKAILNGRPLSAPMARRPVTSQ